MHHGTNHLHIQARTDDILQTADFDTIVNPVNCVQAMGTDIALKFARAYPSILPPIPPPAPPARYRPTIPRSSTSPIPPRPVPTSPTVPLRA